MRKKAGRPKEYHYPQVKLSKNKIAEICETVFRKGIVEIPHLGVFELRTIKARKTYNNFSKKVIVIPQHQRINFEACDDLKTIKKGHLYGVPVFVTSKYDRL